MWPNPNSKNYTHEWDQMQNKEVPTNILAVNSQCMCDITYITLPALWVQFQNDGALTDLTNLFMNLDISVIRNVPCCVPSQESHVPEHLFDRTMAILSLFSGVFC
jgi:hypothetical protein